MNEGLKVLNGQSASGFDALKTDIANLLWYRIPTNIDSTITSTLISQANFIDYQLGDEIINTLQTSSCRAGKPDDISSLYFVCQGQVRLLCSRAQQLRPITAQVVSAGETFGADSYFIGGAPAYRAVAASQVTIAQLPLAELADLLQTCSPLKQ